MRPRTSAQASSSHADADHSLDLTLQRELATGWAVIAGYTGSRALHLWQQGEPNVNRWVGWPDNVPTTQKVFPLRTSPLYGGRINPTFSEIRYQYPNANSTAIANPSSKLKAISVVEIL